MFLKRTISWIVFILGGILGIAGLALLGLQNISYATQDRWWLSFTTASVFFALVPLLASVLAVLDKKLAAAVVFLLPIPFLVRWALLNANYIAGFSWMCRVFAEASSGLGVFWLLAWWWKNWPALVTRSFLVRRRVLLACASFLTICLLDLAATLGLEAVPFPINIDCGIPAVFSESTFGHEALFTAHFLHSGHQVKVSDGWVGSWAMARVQERFRGGWFSSYVFVVANGGLRDGTDYLVDGRRPVGSLTYFLPIVEVRSCNRTSRVADAGVPLRVLRSGFPTGDVRIIGRVIRWEDERPGQMYELRPYAVVPGVKIAIDGPGGTQIVTTDSEGIYDVRGLPPGRYQARLLNAVGETTNFQHGYSDIGPREVAEYSFRLPKGAQAIESN